MWLSTHMSDKVRHFHSGLQSKIYKETHQDQQFRNFQSQHAAPFQRNIS
jgi:hypothetical protein